MPAFSIDDVHPHPDRLWEQDVWEYVVQPEGLSGPGWVHLSVAAREQLGDRDRTWIVDHLNDMATHTSYGVTCANLLRKVLVPDPPEVVAGEDAVTAIARELYARDPDSALPTSRSTTSLRGSGASTSTSRGGSTADAGGEAARGRRLQPWPSMLRR